MSSICPRLTDTEPIRPICSAYLSLIPSGNGAHVISGESTFQCKDSNGESGTGWRWDGQTLTISVGRPSDGPLFLHKTPDGITVAVSLSEIWKKHRLQIDPVAWTVFQITGMYLGNDTPFANVFALSPGSSATWQSGHLTYSEPAFSRKEASKEESVAAEFERLLRYAILRDTPQTHCILELSGGLDSKHLLQVTVAMGRSPNKCVTSNKYVPDHINEKLVARKAAQASGIAWEHVSPRKNRARAECAAALLQGFCSDEGAWWLYRVSAAEPRISWINGIGGDALTGRSLAVEDVPAVEAALKTSDFTRAAAKIIETRRSMILPFLSRRWRLPLCSRRDAIDRIARELERHANAGDPIASFAYSNRICKKLLPAAKLFVRSEHSVVTPFLDDRVASLLLSVGPRLRYGLEFHRRIVFGRDAIPASHEPARRQRGYVIETISGVGSYYLQLHALFREMGLNPKQYIPPMNEMIALKSPRLMVTLLSQSLQIALMQQHCGIEDFRL